MRNIPILSHLSHCNYNFHFNCRLRILKHTSKLDEASDYPELPTTDSDAVKKYNEQVESLHAKIDEKKKLAEKEREKEVLKKAKVEEFKTEDDYVVKGNEKVADLSDFIFVKTKQKKSKAKNKQGANKWSEFE